MIMSYSAYLDLSFLTCEMDIIYRRGKNLRYIEL